MRCKVKGRVANFIKQATWVAIGCFVIRCALSWEQVTTVFNAYDVFDFAGEAVSVTAAFMFLYERWLWKYNPWESMPRLSARYYGKLKSSYDDVERDATLYIKQSLLSVHVTMKSGESKSKSITAVIDEIAEEKLLIYCYLNTPSSEYRNRSEIHYGTAMLCVDDLNKLTGNYYTDRKTRGSMEFISVEA